MCEAVLWIIFPWGFAHKSQKTKGKKERSELVTRLRPQRSLLVALPRRWVAIVVWTLFFLKTVGNIIIIIILIKTPWMGLWGEEGNSVLRKLAASGFSSAFAMDAQSTPFFLSINPSQSSKYGVQPVEFQGSGCQGPFLLSPLLWLRLWLWLFSLGPSPTGHARYRLQSHADALIFFFYLLFSVNGDMQCTVRSYEGAVWWQIHALKPKVWFLAGPRLGRVSSLKFIWRGKTKMYPGKASQIIVSLHLLGRNVIWLSAGFPGPRKQCPPQLCFPVTSSSLFSAKPGSINCAIQNTLQSSWEHGNGW